MKKSAILSIILLSILFNCASKDSTSFLYKGTFFKKGISAVNYPYQLTTDVASEFSPTFSPDGKYIIYVSDKTGNLDLWLYNILSRESYQITYHTSDDKMPSFSKNGKEIIFISLRNNGLGDILQMDFDDIRERCKPGLTEYFIKKLLKDDGAKTITSSRTAKIELYYIDNTYLYFVQSDKKGIKNIFKTKDKQNAKAEQITFTGAISPALSPDKRSLVYIDVSTNQPHHSHIFVLNLTTGEKRQITSGNSIETRPSFINKKFLLYTSTRFDSNKNRKIELNDNSSLYTYNLETGEERQVTPDNYTDYYPIYSRIYGGVIIYTSNLLDNIGLWMIPVDGYLPNLEEDHKQVKFIESLEDDYLKLMGYKNLLNRKNINHDRVNLKIAEIYDKLGYTFEAVTYLSNILLKTTDYTTEVIEAKLSLILNSTTNRQDIITRINTLKNTIKTKPKLKTELHLISFKLSEFYKKNKEYEKSISLLEEIINSYTNKDNFLFKSMNNLIDLQLQFNQFSKAEKYSLLMASYPDFEKKIEFINLFIDLYIKYSPSINKTRTYKKLMEKFKDHYDFYYQILYRHALSIKTGKDTVQTFEQIVIDSTNTYFKIKSLEQLYLITKDEKYLKKITDMPDNQYQETGKIIEKSRNILIKKNLTIARENFNNNNFLSARNYYKKAQNINKKNLGALTGELRCSLKLLKPHEKKYNMLIEKYNKLLKKDPNNYIYYYLKGYGYSLIYSIYYLKYKISLRGGQPSIFGKFINLFKKHKPYPSYYKKKLEKYFKLSEESLKITYRIKPDFIPAYLTSGWLYQVHSEIDKDNSLEYIENAIPLYQSAIHFNDEEKDAEQESFLCLNLANIYFNLKNYSQALQFYHKKSTHSGIFENKLQESFYYYHLGYTSWFLGRDDIAVNSFQKGYTNFMHIKEYQGAYRCIVFTAMINRINYNFKEALNYYTQALNMIKKFNLDVNKERIIRETGICYNSLNDPKTAMSHFNLASRTMPEEKKLSWITWINRWLHRPGIQLHLIDDLAFTIWGADIALGKSFASKGFKNRDEKKLLYALISDTYIQFLNYKKALEYLLLKKKLLEEDKNFDAIPYVNNNLGLLYFKLNDFNSARNYFSESIKLLEKDTKKDKEGNKIPKDMYGIAVNNLNLVEVLLKQYQHQGLKKYFKKVSDILNKSIDICRKNKYHKLLIKANNLYGALYFKKALGNIEKPININNPYTSIRANYQDFLTSLKFYKAAIQFSSSKKRQIDIYYINFNTGLIYYYTKDFNTALETFQQVNLNAKKYLLPDLKWKSEYYILKIKQLLSNDIDPDINYAGIIDQIEELPKGYNYNPVEEPVVENIYNEYIHNLIRESNYMEALKYLEKKKNFAIKETFLSYPFELRKSDQALLKKIKDLENLIINKLNKAQKELTTKFDIKKRNEIETELKSLFTKRSNLLNSSANSKPEFLYYIYKNELPLDEKIKDLSDENGILVLHIYKTGLSLGIITNSTITFQNIRINEKKFRRNMVLLNNNLSENDDITSLKLYFNKAFINDIQRIFKNKKIITIIPDGMLFQFPFHLFLNDKKINYDISLTQFLFNLEKVPLSHLKTSILNYDSRLNKIPAAKNPFPKKTVPVKTLIRTFQKSYIMHIPDGLKFDPFNPVNYQLIYNEDYSVGINSFLKYHFKGELISFENPAENFIPTEKNIYALLLPAYYMGAPAVSFNLWPVKEKINYYFWNNFYNFKKIKLIDKYFNSSDQLYKENNNFSRSYFKVLYGNFGIDLDYKISVLEKRRDDFIENIKTETDITNKISHYNNLIQTIDELHTLNTNYRVEKRPFYTNLIAIYIKNNDYQNALENLNILISEETNIEEKQKFQNQYTNILTSSQMTNNDIEQLNSLIETGDSYYTNKEYEDAVEQYKKALEYLDKSILKGYKRSIIYKLCLSSIADDELKEANVWAQKGLELPEEERSGVFRDKFNLLSAKIDYLNKDYNDALSSLTNIDKKDKDFYTLKVKTLLEMDIPETTKYSQINYIITTNITHLRRDGSLKEIFNPIIDHYTSVKTNAFYFVNEYKNQKLNSDFNLLKIQQALPTNSLLIDFYISDENIYSFLITKDNIIKQDIKLKKFNLLFNEYRRSIQENNEEEFNDVRDSLFELMFEDVEENIMNYSNIIIFPDETLFFINYYNLNNNVFSISNKQIIIIGSYTRLTNNVRRAYNFQGYGIQKNLPGRIITDFSYKEIRELKNYFKGSRTEINPSEIKLSSSYNSFHLSMPVILNRTNITIQDENNERDYDLLNILKDRKLSLLLLTKMSYREFNSSLINRLNTENLILSLWRNNDAFSAIFIRNFYYYLSISGSPKKAFRMSLQKMMSLYKNELAWNSFVLIQF